MTVVTTDNFGFIGVYNATPSTNDWACTYWNWIAVDAILYGLVSHTHDGAAALQNPTGTLSLNTAETGGYLPSGTTYYIGITYVDDLLRETAISTIANITTSTGISSPDTPTIDDDATPTDIQECIGGLTGGDYWYKISYVKDGGETLPSSPVYVQIPTDTTYECTIHFVSLTEAANDADAIYIYRKIGNTGSYVKLAEITAGSTSSYTDDNTGVPTCDKAPVISSTITSFSTITIDWSALDFTDAAYVKIYATTTSGTWPTNALVATVTMNQATPVDSYLWDGTARTAGKPPEVTQCFNNPPKITLDTEVQGNLSWVNLPSDFTWGEPVATSSALPTGIDGEARVVLDEDTVYIWTVDEEWVKMAAGITAVELDSFFDIQEDFDTAVLPYLPEDPYDKQIVIVTNIEDSPVDIFTNVAYMYIWRNDFSPPSWQLINSVLPFTPDGVDYTNNTVPVGAMWVDENSDGECKLRIMQRNGSDRTVVDGYIPVCELAMYWGEFDTVEDLDWIISSYPYLWYGHTAFVWENKSFYYYDDTVATPAWFKQSQPITQQAAIEDLDSATPSVEETKINEILAALRSAGIIED